MFESIDKIVSDMKQKGVPTVDVMGFHVVAGGRLGYEMKMAEFMSDQYWKKWQATMEKEKFDWQKYRDKMADYWAGQELWEQKKKDILAWETGMAGPNASAFGSTLGYLASLARGGGGGRSTADVAAAENRRTNVEQEKVDLQRDQWDWIRRHGTEVNQETDSLRGDSAGTLANPTAAVAGTPGGNGGSAGSSGGGGGGK